jgi:hypothetical protein
MKRSEMIDIIEGVFALYRQTPQDFMTNRGAATIVLNVMENRGMIPPTYWGSDCIGDSYEGQWEREDLGADKIIPAEDFDRLEEELLASGVCPCGSDSYEGCSVTGCALYCYQELKDEKK